MNKARLSLSGLVALALLLVSCGDQPRGDTSPRPSHKVGLALAGPKNDRGFYQAHYDGLLAAQKTHNLKIAVVENLENPQSRIDALKNLAADNELVIGGGAAFAQAAPAVAPQFPNVQFVVSSGMVSPGTANLHAYVVRQGLSAYVAGVVAGKLTRSRKVGYLGGALIPPTTASDNAFKAALKEALPDAQYASTTVGTFSDAAKAKEAARAQIASGVDVIFAFLDAGLPGVLQAIDESGKDVKIFNPISPRCEESPRIVGTAFVDSSKLTQTMVADFLKTRLPAGTKFYGLDDETIQRLDLCPRYRTPELALVVRDITTRLNSGSITLPAGV